VHYLITFGGASFQVGDFGEGIMALQEVLFVDADGFVVDGVHIADTMDSLTFLIDTDDETGLVGLYAKQLHARVRGLEALLRSDEPNMRDVQARLCN
jgi:hypothetical protein